MIQRTGEVVIHLCENVQQKTMHPLITSTIAEGSLVYTDEYNIYHRLVEWGYEHKTRQPQHRGEYACDEDDDGFHAVHVNTTEGFWSLLRSWLRPHRGISQEKLPIYPGFFEYMHNIRKREKAVLNSLVQLLISQDPGRHIKPDFYSLSLTAMH